MIVPEPLRVTFRVRFTWLGGEPAAEAVEDSLLPLPQEIKRKEMRRIAPAERHVY